MRALSLYAQLIFAYVALRLARAPAQNEVWVNKIIALKKELRARGLVPKFLSDGLANYHRARAWFHRRLAQLTDWRGWADYQRWRAGSPKLPAILIIEPNHGHGQIAESMTNYFLNLGYQVDLLLNPALKTDHLDDFLTEKSTGRCFYLGVAWLEKALRQEFLPKRYQLVFFDSMEVWRRFGGWQNSVAVLPVSHLPKFGIWGIIHNFFTLKRDLTYLQAGFVLGALPAAQKSNNSVIYPVNYGQKYATKIHHLNKKRHFIVVGELNPRRRDVASVIAAAQTLIAAGENNFKITLVGQGGEPEIPAALQKYFDYRGALTYPAMYQAIAAADFLIMPLNPHWPIHQRYLKQNITGNYLDVLAFHKPAILAEEFAQVYGFNSRNALILNRHRDLATAMEQALHLSETQYQKYQQNLIKDQKNLIAQTQQVFQNLLAQEAKAAS